MLHRLPSKKAKNRITNLTAALFVIIGVFHLIRVFHGWPASVDTFSVPLWVSWIAVFATFYLAYQLFLMDRN